MTDSSARYIAYDLRPAKQAERRILLDFLKCANEAGINISSCRYVGMGGTKFYDFHLLHRFLGVSHMVSLEQDLSIFPRAEFSCPFDFIDVRNISATDFLAEDTESTPTIYWLDYDGGLSAVVIQDILALGTRLQMGGFAFLTLNAQAPFYLDGLSAQAKLDHFKEHYGDFSANLSVADMEPHNFPNTIRNILVAAMRNSVSARPDGEMKLLFQIEYKDSQSMVTIGGCFCKPEQTKQIEKRLKIDLSFLVSKAPYKIKNLNLTDRERSLFDMAVTKRHARCKEWNKLKKLGFKKSQYDAYSELIRFLPRYVESII